MTTYEQRAAQFASMMEERRELLSRPQVADRNDRRPIVANLRRTLPNSLEESAR